MDNWYETEVRVRYAETDQMGIVHHSNYLVWFEVGRTELCRQKGFSYTEMERDGSLLVVAEVHLRYRSPAFYEDLLTIRTRVGEVRRRSIRFSYEVYRAADDKVLAIGETLHLVTDQAKKVRSLPEDYRRRLTN
ncbi:MAG TPA: thioesterase family protein [Pyrinomonadaceae bacterium]|jgi:acyl-CoA thioester hydrolase|nr:thioesterase family protein [Pyrinomonadaceae bacterium]